MLSGIRKFGLQYSDLPTSMENVAFFMKAVTLRIDLRDERRTYTFFYLRTQIVVINLS